MAIAKASDGRSAELSYQSNTHVPAEASIRCLRDHIVVEPLPVEHSEILDVIEHCKPMRGIIKAVGPGCYPKRYNHPDKHRRTKMWDSKYFQPTEVKVGDIIELGSPQGARGYNFQSFLWGDKLHIICREPDIAGVVCDGC